MNLLETSAFAGLTAQDFDVFAVPGLPARMEALKTTLRPKLAIIGAALAPAVSQTVGRTLFPHVAMHARRTTNPPTDSWVALGADRRGYKKWPTYMVGVWRTHVYVQMGVIYESPLKVPFGHAVALQVARVRDVLDDTWQVYGDYMQPHGIKLGELSDDELIALARRAAQVKRADLLFGWTLSRESCLAMRGEELLQQMHRACTTLAPLYQLAYEGQGVLA